MTDCEPVLISKLADSDRGEVRRIARETAFLGEPLDFCFDDDELLADVLTLYFTDYEPESCFVAVQEGKVIGYLIGTENVRSMRRTFNRKVLPRLFTRATLKGVVLGRKTRRFLFHVAVSLLKGEFRISNFSNEYPATLHINIDRKSRGRKIGTQLIDHYLASLVSRGITGVQVNCMSEEAKNFFEKMGFRTLFMGKRSFLRYCLGKDLPLYVLGKKL